MDWLLTIEDSFKIIYDTIEPLSRELNFGINTEIDKERDIVYNKYGLLYKTPLKEENITEDVEDTEDTESTKTDTNM